jgi:hypothetical protein
MQNIDYTNLVSAPRDNIVEIIQNNVNDPTSSTLNTRKWLYSRTPDTKSRDFSGFPYIIIPSPQISLSNASTGEHSFDGSKKEVTWEVEITIHATDRGWGNNNGKGLQYVNEISNDMMKVFLNRQIRETLRNYGLAFAMPEVSNVDVIEQDNTLLYEVSVFLSFSTRMRISE